MSGQVPPAGPSLRAHTTLSSIGDGVLSVDAAGRIEFMNDAASKLTGWPRADALGRPVADVIRLLGKTSMEPLANPLDLALERGVPSRLPVGTVLVRRDGSETAIETRFAPLLQPTSSTLHRSRAGAAWPASVATVASRPGCVARFGSASYAISS